MNNEKSANQSWFAKHKVLVGVVGALVFFFILGSAALDNGSSPSSPEQQQTTTHTENESEETSDETPGESATDSKSYQEVFTFQGNGSKKSEPFTIRGDRFKIEYDCQGDLCQAYVYEAGSSLPKDLIMNSMDSLQDETILYGSGEFYIDANTIGNYTMTVYDYR